MFEGSTDFLSYALVMFLAWIYLPYTFFRFCAERFIDLGRRRDATQLEEVISAFLPSIVLNVQAILLFKACSVFDPLRFTVDFGVMASIFGQNRGAVSDYIYAGNWWGCVMYLVLLWGLAIAHGLWFGHAAREVCKKPASLNGVEEATREDDEEPDKPCAVLAELDGHQRVAWTIWYPFFRESIAPLFSWNASRPHVRVETKDHRLYYGRFLGYDKTTDGCVDAIRLRDVKQLDGAAKPEDYYRFEKVPLLEYQSLYLNWSEISHISIIPKQLINDFVKSVDDAGRVYQTAPAAIGGLNRSPPPEARLLTPLDRSKT